MVHLVSRQQREVMAMCNKQSEEMLRLHHVHEQQIRDAQRSAAAEEAAPAADVSRLMLAGAAVVGLIGLVAYQFKK